jgi:hypothetical protein
MVLESAIHPVNPVHPVSTTAKSTFTKVLAGEMVRAAGFKPALRGVG